MSTSVRLINPSTEEVIREIKYQSAAEIEQSLVDCSEAYRHWRRLDLHSRSQCVEDFEAALGAARVTLAEMIANEMGKVQREALGEIDKCIASCRTLREKFPRWIREREHTENIGLAGGGQGSGQFSVHSEPLGVLLGIMPWNFPLWQVVRFAIPALLNGNTILLKHAPNTWGVAEFIGELFQGAFPHAAYVNLKVDVPAAEKIIADPRVRGVSLTGSRAAGKSVGVLAGQHLKKLVLELGGSDAYVVLDDADLKLAVEVCAKGRLVNAGQSCVAAKRFIVTRKNHDEFVSMFEARLAAVRFGSPLAADSEIGPLARKDLRDTVHQQVLKSVKGGAELLTGGTVPDQLGFYYPASLLVGVKPGHVAFDEELFGPVAAVTQAANEGEALRLANQSPYGLGSAIFSRDVERAKKLAVEEMDAGMAFVNDFVRSDALVPFGGVKDSGLGRELGREGSFEFTNTKTVFVKS